MSYIIIADVQYYKGGPFVQSYLNIQDEGTFWDNESMDIWTNYSKAFGWAEDLRNDKVFLSRSYEEVKNIRVGSVQIMPEEV